MSAHGDNPKVHAIVDGRFVCTADDDAPCRTHPTCDCESWCCCDGEPEWHDEEGEHCCMTTEAPGQPCWIEPWINESGDIGESFDSGAVTYDASWLPDGPVTVEWQGDYCAWSYADDTKPNDGCLHRDLTTDRAGRPQCVDCGEEPHRRDGATHDA